LKQLAAAFLLAITALLASCGPARAQTEEELRQLEALRALPYLQWTQDRVKAGEHGVTLHDVERACPGYTLYNGPLHAALIDMEGNTVHEWRCPEFREWEHAELQENGDLIVILPRRAIFRLDWDGDLLWSVDVPAHHDFCITPGGDILTIAYQSVLVPEISDTTIVSDALVAVDPETGASEIWSLHEHRDELERWCTTESLTSVPDDVPEGDWSHSNTLEAIAGNASHAAIGAFRPGNLLICVRNLDFVGIIDAETGEIVWGWGPGELDHPHQPTVLESGNILVFDNGYSRGWSRVVEYDPRRRAIAWEYRPAVPREFFSRGRGACQSLPNGNVLITESATGRVFEVTREGETVWSYFNRERERDRRGTFYRTVRYEPELIERLLDAGK